MVEETIILENSDELIDINENFKLTAGPGSGKTRFLINHINNVIKNSNKLKNGRKIACITHTNVAVDNVKKRLKKSTMNVEVSTIHSFLYKHVFKPYIWTVHKEFNLNIYPIQSIKEAYPSHSLLPGEYWMVENIKEENLFDSLRKLKWVYDDNGKLQVKTFGFDNIQYTYLKKYKNNCWKKGLISPEDILFFSYHILTKTPQILTILKTKFPYIFLDEFQDTSALQSEIIKLMANNGINIGVIGDEAQSIYEFQDANIESFINFNIDEPLKKYFIKNNYRSNIDIVNILNHINRNEFQQICCKETNNYIIKPTIIIGNKIGAYKKIVKRLNSKDFYSLTYKNKDINRLKFELDYGNESNYINNINNIFSEDNYYRRLILRYTILAIEAFRNKTIRDAKSFMKFAYKNYKFDDLNALNNLFRLNSKYDSFKDLTITEFYNTYIYDRFGVKYKITNSKVKREYYDKYTYTDFALNLNKKMIDSHFRTIHSCKGEEFKNVALFLDSEEELEFLKKPNILDENHRRYYVALSRTKENLIIVVPTLDKEDYEIFQSIGFNILKL